MLQTNIFSDDLAGYELRNTCLCLQVFFLYKECELYLLVNMQNMETVFCS